ncbi:MAG: hypothetical protein V7765_14005 [Oleispira sp.]
MRFWLRTKKIHRKITENRSKLHYFMKKEEAQGLSVSKMLPYKSSKTLCVLASGKSINDITSSQWDFINSCDSVSLNNTILHKHIPTFLFYETDTDEERHRALSILKFDNLAQRADDFKDVPIIWHYQEKRYFDLDKLRDNDLLKNSYFQTSYSLPGDTTEDFARSLEYAKKKELNKSIDVGLYRRGSLARILHFALALEYEEVVFFGADLIGADYFFDSYTEQDLPKGCKHPNMRDYTYNSKEGLKTQQALHMTVDTSVHPVTMIDVINEINEHWLKPNNLLLQIAHESSALKSILPIKKWQ